MFIVVHVARTKTINKDLELREQRIRNESTNRYLVQIEQHYNELRKFRHEYQNTLLSLEEYLRSDDIEGLKKYYNTSIKPISVALNQEKYKFEDISRVGNKEIKSVIFNKLYAAQLDGIKVSFEAKNEIKDFYMDSLDLALALGIIMDNAIEETRDQEHGTIQVGFIKGNTEIVIIIQNSLRKNDIPVWKMKERGFSSKGSNRGFGLKNLTEIIDRNNMATLETMKLNNYFLQKITISTKG
jgi:Predicted signal transduction protein with a C-terminal ATPase domain